MTPERLALSFCPSEPSENCLDAVKFGPLAEMGLSKAAQLRLRRGAHSLRALLACILLVTCVHLLRIQRKVGRCLSGVCREPSAGAPASLRLYRSLKEALATCRSSTLGSKALAPAPAPAVSWRRPMAAPDALSPLPTALTGTERPRWPSCF